MLRAALEKKTEWVSRPPRLVQLVPFQLFVTNPLVSTNPHVTDQQVRPSLAKQVGTALALASLIYSGGEAGEPCRRTSLTGSKDEIGGNKGAGINANYLNREFRSRIDISAALSRRYCVDS